VHLTFVGLGLIGGSVARAVREAGGWTAAAWSPAGSGPARALGAGVIDAAPRTLAGALVDADLVVLAAPPGACLDLMVRLAGTDRAALADHAVVTDVASTKVLLGARAAHLGLRFVGGHPMAGGEKTGFAAADADLFRDRPWVVVPPAAADEDAVSRVEELARACGARPLRMTAAEHDSAVAAISHLPLVLAAALVEAVAGAPGDPVPPGWPVAAALAASGWAGATRLARGDPTMGAGIARTNAGPLAARLRDVRDRLDEWLALLEQPSADGLPDETLLRERLAAARDRLGNHG
jgi:prephenate dehydrogenase